MLQEIVQRIEDYMRNTAGSSETRHPLQGIATTEIEMLVADAMEARTKLVQGGFSDEDSSFAKLLERAQNVGLSSLCGFVLMQHGTAASHCGRYQTAIELEEQALQLMDPSETRLLSRIYRSIGFQNMALRKYDEAEASLLTSLRIAGEQHDEEEAALSLMTMGQLYLRQGQYIDAREHMVRAIEYFRKNDFTSNLYIALHDYGLLLLNMYDHDNAAQVFEELVEGFDKLGMKDRQGMAYFNLGLAYQRLERYEEAEACYLKSLEMLQALDNKLYFRKMHNNLALTYGQMGKNDLAIKHFKIAYEIAEELGNELEKHTVHINILHHMLLNNQFIEGMRQQIEEACAYFGAHNDDELVIKTKKVLARYYYQKKQYKTAYDVQKEATLLTEEFYSEQLRDQNRDFLESFQESMQRRERIQNLLSPSLQSTVKHSLIGNSAGIREVIEIAKRASAVSSVNVVITGESGTGKEIIARLIHYSSDRCEHRLLTVNCSAITETLAESEFFGHIAGSFTGALQDRTGYFEKANGGTIYLDEIGDMPLDIQAKLLRAIETGKITPIGGDTEIEVDVRIVASTNKDLEQLVQQNLFRLDLLHRINTIHIHIPPLRDRDGDLDMLVKHFVHEAERSFSRRDISIDATYLDGLRGYAFPGNVRELKNIVERSIILEKTNTLTGQSLPALRREKDTPAGLHSGTLKLEQLEKEALFAALEQTGNSQKRAAKLLGITESTLSRKLKRYR